MKRTPITQYPTSFSSCISLGCFCGTASAMGKNGLRSFSGPFDWCWSDDFSAVLRVMEHEFEDYLKKENLQIDGSPSVFRDTKYGFRYNHDVKEDLEKEYPQIAEKYKRRIDRFLLAIQNPTCFFRMVRSTAEVQYIAEHKQDIDRIIKHSNPDNIIVYLLLNNMPILENEIYFYLNQDRFIAEPYEMLTMFDSSDSLLTFCKNLIDPKLIKANRDFYLSFDKKVFILLRDIGLVQAVKRLLGKK